MLKRKVELDSLDLGRVSFSVSSDTSSVSPWCQFLTSGYASRMVSRYVGCFLIG